MRFGDLIFGGNPIDYVVGGLRGVICDEEDTALMSSCNLLELKYNFFFMYRAYKRIADEAAGEIPHDQDNIYGRMFLVNWDYGGEIVATAEPGPEYFVGGPWKPSIAGVRRP